MTLTTVADLAARLARGETTAERLAQAALERAGDPAGEGARAFVRIDREGALAAARAADARREAGKARSPVDGLPISVKDLFDLAGQVTTAGSVVLREGPAAAGPARADAPVIARLRAAGAVIIGRTNMTEFAYSGLGLNPHYGTPRNVWDRGCDGGAGRVPGGSSSGAAVSVADGMVTMGLGTDTGGSVRIPAALNGIAGFKPTASRVPTEGALPLSETQDSIGPLAPSVGCCALFDAIFAGEPAVLPEAVPLAGVRFAVPQTLLTEGLDPEVARDFDRALAAIHAGGAAVDPLPLAELGELQRAIAGGTFATREAWLWHRGLLARDGGRYDPRVRARIEGGAAMSEEAYRRLFELRTELQRRIGERIAGHVALLFPTIACVAPRMSPLVADDAAYVEANLRVLRNTVPINILDGCALTLPIHTPGSAPVGLTVGQLGGHDARVLGLGLSIERALAPVREAAGQR